MKSRAEDRDRRRYCCFHCDYGHDTDECHDLKNQIEDLIRHGHLNWYIRKLREPSLSPKGPVKRQVDIIVGGLATGGVSSSTRKAYARAEVQKRPRAYGDPGITFKSESEYPDHDNALVIMTRIVNARVRHIMIDIGSSISRLENSRADALARSTSVDTASELTTIPSFCQPTVATIKTATTVAHPD
ncbi:hypothetical protein B296_00031976 [Ensete ventricosum]|uniref:Uncharacterized protein n=1 Tax=Ensete ventricosum TaxID=4639 RepID=A0A427A1Q1_ENSVE|nr:hypothetical protein B296_00031976 [Ensete ventricosum]